MSCQKRLAGNQSRVRTLTQRHYRVQGHGAIRYGGSNFNPPFPSPRFAVHGFDRLNRVLFWRKPQGIVFAQEIGERLKNRSDLAMTTRCFPGVDNGSEQWAQDRDSKHTLAIVR